MLFVFCLGQLRQIWMDYLNQFSFYFPLFNYIYMPLAILVFTPLYVSCTV
jgi:hypothetical protein